MVECNFLIGFSGLIPFTMRKLDLLEFTSMKKYLNYQFRLLIRTPRSPSVWISISRRAQSVGKIMKENGRNGLVIY